MYISHNDTISKYIIKINTISSYFMYMCDSRIITYMYVYTYIHVYTYTPTYTHIHLHIHTYTHTYTYTYTYTCIHT